MAVDICETAVKQANDQIRDLQIIVSIQDRLIKSMEAERATMRQVAQLLLELREAYGK